MASKNEVNGNTPEFRGSYINVFQARLNTLNNKMQFSIAAIFEPGTNFLKLESLVENVLTERWGADKAKWPKNIRSPFRKHEEKEKDGVLPDGYKPGGIFMTFSTTENPRSPKPVVYDQRNKKIDEADQSKVYSGAYYIANVTASAYPKKGVTGIAPGVAFYLNGIQLVRDGEPLSGRPSVEKAFAPVEGFEDSQGAVSVFGDLT